MSEDYEKFKAVTETVVEEIHPELSGFYYPVHAVVKGFKSDSMTCSLKLLDKIGNEIDEINAIPFVKVPEGVIVSTGSKVRVLFDYADTSRPVILGVI